MRIVAGTHKGKAVEAPPGNSTRPTTDRVREALFSSLYSARGGFEGAIVLDAFAGSGALGIEALSRGASFAVFYERDRKAADTIKRNVDGCGISPAQAQIVRRDVMQMPPICQDPPFDLVFFDPPYDYSADDVVGLARIMADEGALAPHAIIVYEHAVKSAADVKAAACEAGFEVHASKKYGKTGVTILMA